MSGDERLPPGGQTISCQNCNDPQAVYPPSSEYVETRLETCPRGDTRTAFFECQNCSQRNTFFWHKQHTDERFTPSVG
jgi:hypothetical protein